jgi:hypothetical protein
LEAQAAYLVIAMRQKILTLPQHARKFLGLTEAAQASKILRELAISVLEEIAHLPEQVTDPHWLRQTSKPSEMASPNWPAPNLASTSQRESAARKRPKGFAGEGHGSEVARSSAKG